MKINQKYFAVFIFFILTACSLSLSSTDNVGQIRVTQEPGSPQTTLDSNSSPNPLVFWTPYPTLVPGEANRIFESWILGTPDCKYPCWAGMTPGKTQWVEARDKFFPLFDESISIGSANCRFGLCQSLSWQYKISETVYSGIVQKKDELIYSFYILEMYGSEMNIQRIFKTYGIPDEMLIYANPGTPPYGAIVDLVILYPGSKFMIKYSWNAQNDKNSIVACGQPITTLLAIVDITEFEWSSVEIDHEGNIPDDGRIEIGLPRQRISDVTNYSEEELYDLVIQNGSSFCISTPVKYWNGQFNKPE